MNQSKKPQVVITEAELQAYLRSLRVRPGAGKQALKSALVMLPEQTESSAPEWSETSRSVWFKKAPAMVGTLALLALVVVGGGWVVLDNGSSASLVTRQAQTPNGSVQNAAQAQILDAQDDSTLANDNAAIETASAQLDSAAKIGDTLNENQF